MLRPGPHKISGVIGVANPSWNSSNHWLYGEKDGEIDVEQS